MLRYYNRVTADEYDDYEAAHGVAWNYWAPTATQLAWFAVALQSITQANGDTIRDYVHVLPNALHAQAMTLLVPGADAAVVAAVEAGPTKISRSVKFLLDNMALARAARKAPVDIAPLSTRALQRVAAAAGVDQSVKVAVLLVWRVGVRPSTAYCSRYTWAVPGAQLDVLCMGHMEPHGTGVSVRPRAEKQYKRAFERHAIIVEEAKGEAACLVTALRKLTWQRWGCSLEDAIELYPEEKVVPDTVTDAMVTAALRRYEASHLRITPRSVRRGAATALANAPGVSVSELKQWGFWRSEAFENYTFWGYHEPVVSGKVLTQKGAGAGKGGAAAAPAPQGGQADAGGQLAPVVVDMAHAGLWPRSGEWVGVGVPHAYFYRRGFVVAATRRRGARLYWLPASSMPEGQLQYSDVGDMGDMERMAGDKQAPTVTAAVLGLKSYMAAERTTDVAVAIEDAIGMSGQ